MTATLRTPRVHLVLEELESRLVPSATPTAYEQQMLEQLNAIRANPAAYGASIGLDLSTVAPSQPLAFNPGLIQAAQGHSLDMSVNNYFAHTAPSGSSPGDRMTAAGVPWLSYGESIAAGYSTPATALQGLIIDAGVPDLGHRVQLLAMTSTFRAEQEVGIGVTLNGSGSYGNYFTIDTTETADNRPYLTGVVFNDANNNGQYDVGEGLGDVTLTIAGVGSVTTWSSGGYSWQLNPGTYTVTASGPGLAVPVSKTVTLTTTNVELDFLAPTVSAATVAANSAWVQTQFQTLLHRNGNQADVAFWANQLTAGTITSAGVTAAFEGSQEFAAINTLWVQSLYRDLLNWQASAADVSFWVQGLQQGWSPTTVATDILLSQSSQETQWASWITHGYQTFLKRTPDANGMAYWMNAFQGGLTQATFTAELASSAEFVGQTGTSNANWISNLYGNLLQRQAGTADMNYCLAVLQSGASRQTLVELLEQSNEYRQLQTQGFVQGLYQSLLGRTGSVKDVGYFVYQLDNGASQETVAVEFLLSGEYFSRAMSM